MYEPLIEKRDEEVGGVSDWYWLKTDIGAWNGPSKEWAPLRDLVADAQAKRRKSRKSSTSICVQAGGCLGMYPRLWSDIYGTVYTFEPDPLNFHVLCLNNQRDSVVKYNAALGDGSRVTMTKGSDKNVGEHHAAPDQNGRATMRIDWLNLPGCDLIQLDVERFEAQVLAGAMQTIQAYNPIVTVETTDGVAELLGPLGYTVLGRGGYDTVFVPRY
jgi:FkbM family methyltransferase